MKWLSLDTSPPSYRSECGAYLIVHEVAGFGIWPLRLYNGSMRIGEWTGSGALPEAMSAAERHSRFVPELEFANVQGGER